MATIKETFLLEKGLRFSHYWGGFSYHIVDGQGDKDILSEANKFYATPTNEFGEELIVIRPFDRSSEFDYSNFNENKMW